MTLEPVTGASGPRGHPHGAATPTVCACAPGVRYETFSFFRLKMCYELNGVRLKIHVCKPLLLGPQKETLLGGGVGKEGVKVG